MNVDAELLSLARKRIKLIVYETYNDAIDAITKRLGVNLPPADYICEEVKQKYKHGLKLKELKISVFDENTNNWYDVERTHMPVWSSR